MAKLVSQVYGEALFGVAMEAQTSDKTDKCREILEEVYQFQKILKENPDFDKLLMHPGIPKQEKMEVMKQVFEGRISNELFGFLEAVLAKERYKELPAIFAYFESKVKEKDQIGVVFVTTAVELTDTQKKRISDRVLETTSYQSLEMHYHVDEQLIGGAVIRINDRVVDSSIRTKINDLTKQLLQIQLG